jgi:hypothetical protein
MKDWLVEAIDQVALGEVLADSTVTCGQRFGLIAVDNSIEFMLIAYVQLHRQLVGGHKTGGIPKRDWENKKATFPSLLSFVTSLEPSLSALEPEILRYHNFRSDLYHSGLPTTTSAERVHKYGVIARQVLDVLFSLPLTPKEWASKLLSVAEALRTPEAQEDLRREVKFEEADGVIRFTCNEVPKAKFAIALAIHGFFKLKAIPPDRKQLGKALALSGQSLSGAIVNTRITELRNTGWLQKSHLLLTGKARKGLEREFII